MRSLAVAAVVAVAACGGGDDGAPAPVVDQIGDAIAAVEEHYGAPQEFYEISADLRRVSVIVATDGATTAERVVFEDGVLDGPVVIGEAAGDTFTAAEVDLDPDRLFEQIRAELGDPVIVDVAVQGGPGDRVLIDATVAGDAGGVLLVLLGPDGRILGVQGR